MGNTPPPLQSVRILDLSRLIPGPYATRILADLGARVDKVEDPALGDYLRQFPPLKGNAGGRFRALNPSKRSLALDLKKPQGKKALLKLLPHYDVLLESFRPGVMQRLGLDYATLAQHAPKLVVCSISGYGQTGPLAKRAGHDLNFLALSGLLHMFYPQAVVPPVQLADVAAGLWSAIGIVAGLFAAEKTGHGRHIDISMCEAALAFWLADWGNYEVTGQAPEPGEDLLSGGAPGYSLYRTKDERFLAVASLEPKFWTSFNRAIGREPQVDDMVAERGVQERVRAEVQAILSSRTQAEWREVFAAVDACVEPVLNWQEVFSHPQHQAREVVKGHAVPLLRTPLGIGVAESDNAAPNLGQHSAEILREAGFSDVEIGQLVHAGAVH